MLALANPAPRNHKLDLLLTALAVLAAVLSWQFYPFFAEYDTVDFLESLEPVVLARRDLWGTILVLQGLCLLWWRTRLWLALGMFTLLEVIYWVLVPIEPSKNMVILFLCFRVGMVLPLGKGLAIITSLSAVGLLVGSLAAWRQQLPVMPVVLIHLLSLVSYGLILAIGVAVGLWRQNQNLLLERRTREQDRLVEQAVADERTRLAGEVHDVAAHHLAGITIQAAAIIRLIDRDPEAAKQAADQLRRQSKQALAGLRSLVGALRDHPAADVNPGLVHLAQLAETTRSLGIAVSFEAPTSLPCVAPVMEAAAFRVAQQAVSNALQHAPGAAISISLTQQPAHLVLDVINGPARISRQLTAGGGAGLQVMRERARAIGADLATGPTPEGGWRVSLTFPLLPADTPRPQLEEI